MIDEIIFGESFDYAVDIIITVRELDEILHRYKTSTTTSTDTKFYNKLKTIREVLAMDGIKRLGIIDKSKSNWRN